METIGMHEKRAVAWDRFVTLIIVGLLFLPLPFARFQTAPQMTILLERPILPWSRFTIRCLSFPEGIVMESSYGFTWKGQLVPMEDGRPTSPVQEIAFPISPVSEPLLRWQNNPDIRLGDLFVRGETLTVNSFWQPLLLWPVRMGWQARPS
jgi:hypothetical protein